MVAPLLGNTLLKTIPLAPSVEYWKVGTCFFFLRAFNAFQLPALLLIFKLRRLL